MTDNPTPTSGGSTGLTDQAPPSQQGPSRFVPQGAAPEVSDVERVGAGPARFGGPVVAEKPPSVLTRLGYLLAIIAIVVGIPALLWFLSGPPPIPTSLPSRSDLTQPIGIEQVLSVLVAVVWIAWLQFVVCLAVEFLSAIRGGGVPTAVPLSGPSQRLARALVGGVLLAGVIGGQVAAVIGSTSGGVADRSSSSVSASATPGADGVGSGIRITPFQQAAVDAENELNAQTAAASAADMTMTPAGDDALVGHKVYTVKPPVGHYHDNLWDIAERHLGDGRRYQEIYQLNKDRLQPDGKSLHLARLIQPGWQLVMPEDAIGIARLAAPDAPTTPAPAPAPTPAPTPAPAPTPEPEPPAPAPSAGEDHRDFAHDLATGGQQEARVVTVPLGGQEGADVVLELGEDPDAPETVPEVTPSETPTETPTDTPTDTATETPAPSQDPTTPAPEATTPTPTEAPSETPSEAPTDGVNEAPSADLSGGAVIEPALYDGGSADAVPTSTPASTPASAPAASAVAAGDYLSAPDPLLASVDLGDPEATRAASPDIARSPLVAGLASGGLFAATLAVALAARRARTRGGAETGAAAREAEVGITVGADVDRAVWLDRALRGLAATCADGGLALPNIQAVLIDEQRAELVLALPRPDAPAPWVVEEDGRRWTLAREVAPTTANGPAPYPALVCVGRDEGGRDLLIDLEATEGPVQVTGDVHTSVQVASALAVQLATLPWSDDVQVRALGLPVEAATIAGPRLGVVTDLDQTVTELETALLPSRGHDVLSSRLTRVHARTPYYLVTAQPVSQPQALRITALNQSGRQPFGAVMVGSVPGARWHIEVDATGTLRVPQLGMTVVAHRLVDSQLPAVAELFTAADATYTVPTGGRPDVPPAPYEVDDVILSTHPVAVSLLGTLGIRGEGPIDPGRLPLAEELVAFVACHPGGVHPGVLAGAIWPRGVSHAVAAATIELVRDWLGTAADGTARLREDHDGRLHLSPDVAVDWYAVCSLLTRARRASSEREEVDLLRRALRLARGPLLQGRPQGRYAWLARTGLDRAVPALVVDAAHRLVRLSIRSNPVDAAVAARVGLRVEVGAQELWRDLIEVQHRQGGAVGAQAVVTEMREALDRVGVAVEPETDALVDHLTAGTPTPA